MIFVRPLTALALLLLPPPESFAQSLKLTPGKATHGWLRQIPEAVAPGILNESPTLAVLSERSVALAWVQFDADAHREKLLYREWTDGVFGASQVLSEGPRAWHPRLFRSSADSLWAVWCGLDSFPERGEHGRKIYLRRLRPELGPPEEVSRGSGRNCDPEVSVHESGRFLIAWESEASQRFESAIDYRIYSPEGRAQSQPRPVQPLAFDRRPSVRAVKDGWELVWDRFMDRAPSAGDDPNYDLWFARVSMKGQVSAVSPIDLGEGIQAAPTWLSTGSSSAALVYHSTQGHSLVKHSQVLRFDSSTGQFERAKLKNELEEQESRGEMQGSEFPVAAYHAKKGLVWATRPSQGFYLHRLEGEQIITWDLTLAGWSARGIQAQLAFSPAGVLYVVRRAAREVVFERIELPDLPKMKAPRWTTLGALKPLKFVPGKPPRRPRPPPAPGKEKYAVYFGDVHMHSAISDATGTADEVIARAFVRGLDFATLTDHDTVGGSRMLPSEYAEISWLTDVFGRLSGFTTLHAYEWTTPLLPKGSGHRNVYFEGHGPEEVYTTGNGHGDTQKLFAALKGEKAFAVPHHTTWTGTDWENHDDAIQRQVEVVSAHGASDEPNGPIESRGEMSGMFAVDGLKRGLHFGFIAGTDGHGLIYHHGVARHRDPWAHAVTGVIAKAADRATLWHALYERRTFGTSGPRMRAFLKWSQAWQGEQVAAGAHHRLEYEVHGTHTLVKVELFRNGELWKVFPVKDGARDAQGQIKVEDLPADRETSYFLRATEKGRLAPVEAVWTSPVFIRPP